MSYLATPAKKGVVMFKFFQLAFQSSPAPAAPNDVIDRTTMRDIVSARSHGNVRLQDGRYYTGEDLDAEYRALRETALIR